MSVPLTLACERYDRTEALRDGRVQVAGVDLTYLPLQVEETFFRMARFQEFDAAEMSLSSYTVSLSRGAPFVAIPVFPSRFFRHSGIYVSAASGIEQPADLRGKRIGMAEYQLTANVWIRGILEERYGVPLATGIFPIMHVVVLRRDVYERNRWLARSLYEAFDEAKRRAEDNFRETATLRYMLPWLDDEVRRTTSILGDDWWPYGLERNEKTLDTFLGYHHAQGLSPERLTPRDLFAPETLEVTRV